MRLLIKLGGALVDEAASRRRLAGELGELQEQGHQVVVVHGGGKQMTRFLEERGVASRFVGGLRVTTPEVLDAVVKVVAGSVNQALVSALVAGGYRAVGLTGVDDCLAEAATLSAELGAVGRIERVNASLLELLAGAGFLPVVACLAGDRQGNVYNVNADQMAVACASAWKAERLFFLTDVRGVLNERGEILSQLTAEGARDLIKTGVATGGMQAKLTAAMGALEQGVEEVVIAPGAEEGMLRALLGGETAGTRIVSAG